jgi:hypothetical protein
MREPLPFRQVTLAPAQCFFRPMALGRVHHRSNKLDAARLISFSMSHNVDMFDRTIRHHQAIFKVKIISILRRALDDLFHKDRVFRMNSLEDKFGGWFRRSVVLKDSKGFP